jgi:hypothetical protein
MTKVLQPWSISLLLPNYAFERPVMPRRRRAASALGYCAPAARIMRQCAAAQREC